MGVATTIEATAQTAHGGARSQPAWRWSRSRCRRRAQARASTFPRLTGRVVDEAGVLPDSARVALVSKLAALEARTTDQVVVVTLRSLRGQTIEQYGVALGRQWQIGQSGKNNGVLLVVAPNERKVRIEVGYGLEGTLPDAVAKLIIEQTHPDAPFRDNDYGRHRARRRRHHPGAHRRRRRVAAARRAAGVSPSPIDRLAGALGVPSAALRVGSLSRRWRSSPWSAGSSSRSSSTSSSGSARCRSSRDRLACAIGKRRHRASIRAPPWGGTSAGSFGSAGGFSGGGGNSGGGGASGSW